MVTKEQVLEALGAVIDPELGLDFVTLGLIYDVQISDGEVEVVYTLTSPGCPIGPQVAVEIIEFVGALEAVRKVTPRLTFTHRGQWSASARTRGLRSVTEREAGTLAPRRLRGETDADRRDVCAPGPPGGGSGSPAQQLGALDGPSRLFAALGGALIVAGGLIAAVNSAAPFAHGSWLAAYLVLIGGVSQLLLGLGCLVPATPGPSLRLRRAQLALWNSGNLAVVAGVFGSAAGLVTIGSAVLLAALACFAVGAGLGRRGARRGVIAYHAVIAVLAVSVVVGSALADAAPGAWI